MKTRPLHAESKIIGGMKAEPPLRAALFSTEQMRQHGIILAGSHTLSSKSLSDHTLLTIRLAENRVVLQKIRAMLSGEIAENHKITPAGEWLLDNFYLIEEQIRTTRLLLPKGYSRSLPFLQTGSSAGLPRVYDIALEMISHGDGRVDPETLKSFVAWYQSVSPLKLGELWAIPIMLRLALVENLRRVASRTALDMGEQQRAGYWADRMIDVAENDPKNLILEIAEMVRSDPPMVSSFVAELSRRLQGQGPGLALPLSWIEQRLLESGSTIHQLVDAEIQQQAADQVSMGNSIGSLRYLNTMDWHEFVEGLSIVNKILAEDPSGFYPMMDFSTRDSYRHVIEKIADKSGLSEIEVARKAVVLSWKGMERKGIGDRTAHVGYYLIDDGLAALESATGIRLSFSETLAKKLRRFPLFVYLGSVALVAIAITSVILLGTYDPGLPGWAFVFWGILAFFCATQPAVKIVNWITSLVSVPEPLPRLDYSKGIAPESKTLVVVPSMFSSSQNVDELFESLEVKFLANQSPNLYFALLTDFPDADEQTLPTDSALLETARLRTLALNVKYPSAEGDTFFLFHRPRLWNPCQKKWMGYERKRGKLEALNSYLRGDGQRLFSLVAGDTAGLSNMKYVITLDADTKLQRETAWQFVGAMAHPLNRPLYDAAKRRVVSGYGIIQPRVSMILQGSNRSRYATLCGSEPGIDPYTRTISDLYQDLFREGSYIGKGIYEIDTFRMVLEDAFPENLVLSHDLLEGCYSRSGLLSDVQLVEEYPSRYMADIRRRHRWIRGDWQIAGWLLPFVPGRNGERRKNPLSALSRWKILDNLRRSLIPPALTTFFILAWTAFASPWFATIAALGFVFAPILLVPVVDAFKKPREMSWDQHTKEVLRSTGRSLAEGAFSLACLPHEALYSLNAIIVTLWRMLISRKHLLDWETAAESDRISDKNLVGHYTRMWMAPVLAVATGSAMALSGSPVLYPVFLVLCLWFGSPAVAWIMSKPLLKKEIRLSAGQIGFLGSLSRKTWSYFETFVGPEDNWLPPDNFQEHPVAAIAHRTSPTNMGLSLLANLAAYDFGYITAGDCIERTRLSLDAMERLDRHRGHFFNWYDTQTLQALMPQYISSVDSGNLAAYLLTLKSGMSEIPGESILGPRFFSGLGYTLSVLSETIEGKIPSWLTAIQGDISSMYDSPAKTLGVIYAFLRRLDRAASDATDFMTNAPDSPTTRWAQKFFVQCRSALSELSRFAPWACDTEFLRAFPQFDEVPSLHSLARMSTQLPPAELDFPDAFRTLVSETGLRAAERIAEIETTVSRLDKLCVMDYGFLYDAERRLLSIGYNVTDGRRDSGYYDLLASEARLCSFVAIAQGQLPQENWFALGRQLNAGSGGPVLLSWGGSMFEYLMPLIVMPAFEASLLDQTYKAVINRQIEYGRQCGVPWGISESGYFLIDANRIYQYRAFGIPGMGLRRGLADDLVISPYSTALALIVAPEEAIANLRRLSDDGLTGAYGLYEAIDFTTARLPPGETFAVVRSFMAHHQGMSLLSMAHTLLNKPMQRRFHNESILRATEPLLQERIPRVAPIHPTTTEIPDFRDKTAEPELPMRIFDDPNTLTPEVQLLSNGRYQVMVTNSGGGYSRWKETAVTRWREDGTRDNWGSFCYIRDPASGEFWSTAYQPTLKKPEYYEAIFSEGRVEFRREDFGIDTHTSIVVSPEDDIEIRRTVVTNRTRLRRSLELTSYSEIVLTSHTADEQHPAFINLFMQTEIDKDRHAILCHRRPRSVTEKQQWFFHLMTAYGVEPDEVSYETDRSQFIGRLNTTAAPKAMSDAGALSGGEGSVLDPIAAIRYRIALDPGESATIDIISGVSETRPAAHGLIGKYLDRFLSDRVFELAYTHSQVVLRQLNAAEADAQLYGYLAGFIIFASASLRADSSVISRNRRGQSGLWGYSISGDLPIVLLQIENIANINLVRQMIQAHNYWRIKGLSVDLVIWNEDHAGYRQLLYDQIMGLLATGAENNYTDRPGGVFVRSSDQISIEDRMLIQAAARVSISDNRGTLAEQANRRVGTKKSLPPPLPQRPVSFPAFHPVVHVEPRLDLLFFNGYGGFTSDAREYIVTTAPGQVTPAPWVNVLANPQFGTIVSESGQAYTWAENAHEFRVTPWHNDPVSDSGGEAFYIRDEERGHFWSPMPLPRPGESPYVTRHGFGYSVFEHTERAIRSEAWVYVATDANVKFTVIRVKNVSGRPRRLSVSGYVEWVLGDLRSKSAMHIVTEIDPTSGAFFARNGYSVDFPGRTAFFDTDGTTRTLTGDRAEFIGRNGSLREPAAMTRAGLSGRVGAGLDPCAAIQVAFDLDEGEEREIVFRLGVGRDVKDASSLVARHRGSHAARTALEAVWTYWNHTLGAVRVETPDQALNCIANGWLVYQTLACRMWGRSGYYQSGGAFGFRDQLQDSMALIHTEPRLAREHLLLCASRQFVDGDVQHWWHPPSGRGVRTHCSDDFLWLPLAAARYVTSSGDTGVLDESLPFLEGRQVKADEDSYYDLPNRARETASLYEHCRRAIIRGDALGEHGLPLMGSGDWNDGMNLVGEKGKGESVWLGFFFYEVLTAFAKVAEKKADTEFAARCRDKAATLQQSIEQSGWDGDWYRRAYFDDGRMLGSATNQECRIDSISQSWSVLSGAGGTVRRRSAMEAVSEHLVSRTDGIVKLLAPPFDVSDLNPGYIKGYVPGVRENGGQYTHAAVWAAMAFAKLGDSKRAWELTSMINPVNHARSKKEVAVYKVEPYVVAADVYGSYPHAGRGGWSWYSGSAGWMYRLIAESLLGLRLEVDRLYIEPCIPDSWDTYTIHYRYRETFYHIVAYRLSPGDSPRIIIDGTASTGTAVLLRDDRRDHHVQARVIPPVSAV